MSASCLSLYGVAVNFCAPCFLLYVVTPAAHLQMNARRGFNLQWPLNCQLIHSHLAPCYKNRSAAARRPVLFNLLTFLRRPVFQYFEEISMGTVLILMVKGPLHQFFKLCLKYEEKIVYHRDANHFWCVASWKEKSRDLSRNFCVASLCVALIP